mmetsp:Transcript_12191/g.24790  ORF Transcript_12191/g.24790 Transcript_12191/m.24790 type:complete len:597 (+) Transcript_12191:148-1938(+)|eukprot:CAMPEP_0197556480 /NCGR_PEP_ID=MMETSP1320-20131121/15212_1 /TAXON_ID=91990 /ORGANISM="Bolidomonas sp., Strain RCC2347" /LENGTH=596 /DNA_ID=CAMNT_0043117613 /DNA_START=79 /DNA_END=1869 /DNA_ORIENTATION=-
MASRQMAHLLALAMAIMLVVLLVLNYTMHSQIEASGTKLNPGPSLSTQQDAMLRERAMNLLKKQEDTILALTEELQEVRREQASSIKLASPQPSHLQPEVTNLKLKELEELRKSVTQLESQLQDARSSASRAPPPSAPAPASVSAPISSYQMTASEKDCDDKFGGGLVRSWMSSPTEVCSGGTSKMTCYSHKHFFNSAKQWFCVAENFVIDFSKVKGEHSNKKPSRGAAQYHSFERGSLSADCSKTGSYKQVQFMHHHGLQMNTFVDESSGDHDEVEGGVTYLLARDEDSENAFHSTADFLNMHTVYTALELPTSTSVVLFDKQPDGPFYDMIETVFSSKNLRRKADFQGRVKFSKLVFHMESPASIIFQKVGGQKKALECTSSSLWKGYAARVLQAYDLYDVPPPPVPTATLILRNRTPEKNVGRVLKNAGEVEAAMRRCDLCDVRVVDLATMSYREQIALVRSSSILVGVHGAGLMNIIFAAQEAVLLEIHPHYRLDRHFRIASRLAGKAYMPMRTRTQVTCHGTSDDVHVEVEEFGRAFDGAVRLARNFDDGQVECGVACPAEVLAIDGNHDAEFKRLGVKKGNAASTRFPCG